MTTFGDRLRELRLARGLSQAQLAGEDLSPSYVSLLESGKRQPSPEVTRLLADRLSCDAVELEDPDLQRHLQLAQLELSFARLALAHGDSESARTRLEALLESKTIDRDTRDRAQFLLAVSHEKAHDLDAAVRTMLPVYRRAIRGECQLPLPTIGINVCRFLIDAGDLHAATRIGEEALQVGEERGLKATNEYLRLAATVADAYYELGDLTQAASHIDDFIQIAEQGDLPEGQSALYWNAALIAEARDRHEEALHLCERALALVSEGDTTRDLGRLRSDVAWLILWTDPSRAPEATAILERALPDLQDLGSPADLATWERVRSLADLLTGSPEQAERTARQALLHLSAYPDAETARVLITLGDAIAVQGHTSEACTQYHGAMESLSALPVSRHTASLWREIADRLLLFNETDPAVKAYQQALNAAGVRSHLATLETAKRVATKRVSRERTARTRSVT
ncbi:MAG: helix-turn-helix domain-containing protein [Actinomycetales bacterium]|nr:helix-turn-helix domain-containing protein [Actinomycetales bacterium]